MFFSGVVVTVSSALLIFSIVSELWFSAGGWAFTLATYLVLIFRKVMEDFT